MRWFKRMTKIRHSKYKMSRRLKVSLWGREKDSFNVRNYPPGQHGASVFRKRSTYGEQLMEKQKVRFYYDIQEKSFRRFYQAALKKRGNTAFNLAGLLALRLDVVLFTGGLASTIFAAKQMVSHKHVTVNGKVVSYRGVVLKVGDVVQVRERIRNSQIVQDASKQFASSPCFLEADHSNFTVKVISLPDSMEDVPVKVGSGVVEYLS